MTENSCPNKLNFMLDSYKCLKNCDMESSQSDSTFLAIIFSFTIQINTKKSRGSVETRKINHTSLIPSETLFIIEME